MIVGREVSGKTAKQGCRGYEMASIPVMIMAMQSWAGIEGCFSHEANEKRLR